MRGAVHRVEPLSPRERSQLHRILLTSTRGRPHLHPRQRAALDAYAEILASPPFTEDEVISTARAVIRVWEEVSAMSSPPRATAVAKRYFIPAELLELEEVPPFIDLTHDLMTSSMIESATEVVMAKSPLYDLADRATEVVRFKTLEKLTDAG